MTVQGAGGTRNDQPQPFHEGNKNDGSSNSTDAKSAAEAKDAMNPDPGLPLHDSASLPAGTLLTVRLNSSISADGSNPTGTFDAVVDEPVVVNGVALVPRGANAEGRVESSRTSSVQHNRGYVRLTLASIGISGRDLPVQTSSLFARGRTEDDQASGDGTTPSVVHLDKGRRLTFRLTGPVRVEPETSR